MASRGQTTTNIDSFVGTLYTQELIELAHANLVAAPACWDLGYLYEPGMKTYKLPSTAAFTATAKTRGTDLTPQDVTDSEKTIALDQFYEASVLYEKDVLKTALPALQTADLEEMAYAISAKIDATILAQYASLTLTTESCTSNTGDTLWQNWINVVKKLDTANVPKEGRVAFVHPEMFARLLNVSKVVSVDYVPTDKYPSRTGLIGSLLGIAIYETTQVVSTTVSATTTYYNVVGHYKMFANMIGFNDLNGPDYIPKSLGYLYSANALWGVAVPYPGRGLQVTCTA